MSSKTPRQIRRSRLLRGLLRATDSVQWVRGNLEQFAAALVIRGLSNVEVEQITIDIYENNMRIYRPEQGLFDWEENAFQHLPSPPARIFIPGAGMGREAFALEDRGYEVWASEPTQAGYSALTTRLGARARRGSFGEALAHDWPGPVDAVVVGWTAISYQLGASARARTLRRLSSITHGPLIVSIFSGKRAPRAWLMGSRIARLSTPATGFLPHAGYFEEIQQEEVLRWVSNPQEFVEIRAKHPGVFVLRPQ